MMDLVRLFLLAVLLINAPSSGNAWTHGIHLIGGTVVNIDSFTYPFLNIAHSLRGGSTQAGWAGALTANGYPTSALSTASITNNTLAAIRSYYGRYKIWWTGTGALDLSSIAIIYSGGTSTSLNANTGSFPFNFFIGHNGATTQPTAGSPVEFAFGALINGIADNGSGFVRLTANLSNAFSGISPVGTFYQVNNITNLAPGPYTVTAKTNNTIDLNVAYNATMAVVGGAVGTQSEAIANGSNQTWTFPRQGLFGAAYSGFDNLVICRSQNVGWSGQNDCAQVANHLVNPDYVNVFKIPNLNPRFVRFMSVSGVINSTATSFGGRTSTTQLAWTVGSGWFQGYWGGLITNGGSDNFTTASNPTSSPVSGPALDGEVVAGYIDAAAANTGMSPTLVVNRPGFGSPKHIVGLNVAALSLLMSGPVPPTATTISLQFTGGGLASPFTYTYLTSTSVNGPGGVLDTSFVNIATNIRSDLNGNIRGHSGALVTANIFAQNVEITGGAQITFGYNPNINSSGVAQLAAGMTITGSDSATSATYTFGFVPIGYLTNNHHFVFTFSALADAWIAIDNGATEVAGVNSTAPLEWFEEFCVQANVGFWFNVPTLASDDYVTQTVTHIANSGVRELALEVANETWNTGGGGQWHIYNSLGQYLGIKSEFVGGSSQNSYYGLRVSQVANAARAAWAAAGRDPSQIYITNAYQFVNPNTTQRFNGASLNPAANVTLAAFGGSPSNGTTSPTGTSTNYSTFPNRPVDNVDWLSPAPYFQGVQFNGSFGQGIITSVPLAAYNCSLVASYNFVNGNVSEQSAALDFMFNGTSGDFYTLTGLNGGTISSATALKGFALGSGALAAAYWGVPTIAASYDSARVGVGKRPLGIVAYEGDAEADPVDAAGITKITTNLTTLGDTSGYTSSLGASCGMVPHSAGPTSTVAGDASNMAALLLGFKNNDRYRLLYLQYFNDFKTAGLSQGSRMVLPTTFGFDGALSWSKYPGSFYNTPYKSWDAIQQFNAQP